MRGQKHAGRGITMLTTVNTKKVTSANYNVTTIEKKVDKLDKYFSDDAEATVHLIEYKNGKIKTEVTILHKGTFYRSEIIDDDYLSAIERAVNVIEGQIRKNKTRLKKRLRDGAFDKSATAAAPDESEDTPVVARTKSFAVREMEIEEAIMQMNLLSHEFFIFKNAKSGIINVVYKRSGNEYGLLIPTDE